MERKLRNKKSYLLEENDLPLKAIKPTSIQHEISIETKNPIDSLDFKNLKFKEHYISYNKMIFPFVVFTIFTSIVLNDYFLSLDSHLAKVLNGFQFNSSASIFSFFSNKPYMVTIGEFLDLDSARKYAVELLPEFKQINIKELHSGIYTFEIENFSSKDSAISLAKDLSNAGFSGVKIRYVKPSP